MYKNMFDLSGQVAVVTGGAGGIGGACAMGMAEFGAKVVIADIDLAAAEKMASRINDSGCSAVAAELDITNLKGIEDVFEKVSSDFGKIDILLNNAAITARKPVMELTQEEWDRIIAVNLTSSFMLSKAIGKEFIKNRKGKLIQIASTGAFRAGVNFSAYGASKAGLVQLVKTLALEWAPYGINVNAIAPTATDTNFTSDYYAQFPERKEAVIKNHPFGRLALPEDYVGAAVYLASRASDFVNGEVLVVDSGKTIK